MAELNVVTGGLSYIGKYITRRLVSGGKKVVILTGHRNRPNPFGNQVTIVPGKLGTDLFFRMPGRSSFSHP